MTPQQKDAIEKVLKAITNKGSHPEYHDSVILKHSTEWPTLWRALDNLLQVFRAM